jgi:RimJ/RimL family protein N-acetyltransferase
MYFRKIVGTKCYLSPIDINDAEEITGWLNDLNVTINLNLYSKNINTDNEAAILENVSKDHYYAIIDKEINKLIGCCSFKNIDQLNQTAEIGIYIGNKSYWNKGYGSEALTILLDYGFKALNLHNVLLTVFDFNEGAKRCYEKVGFKEIGIRREGLFRNLKKHDIIYMDILCNEFYENNKKIKEIESQYRLI